MEPVVPSGRPRHYRLMLPSALIALGGFLLGTGPGQALTPEASLRSIAGLDARQPSGLAPIVLAQSSSSNPFISGAPGGRLPGSQPRVGRPPKRFYVAPGEEPNRLPDPPDKFFVTPKTPLNYYKASPAYRYECFDPCRRAGGSPTACERECLVKRK